MIATIARNEGEAVYLPRLLSCAGHMMIPRLLVLPFYPSYASFTFPFVITATAKKVAVLAATRLGQPLIGLSVIAGGELVIAAVLCAYVVLRFSMDIVREARTA